MKLTTIMFLACCGLGACRATTPAPEVETVGALAPSYRSIATAPVHTTTDLSPGFQAVSSDDDADVGTAPAAPVETPDVAPKMAHGF